MKKKVFTDSSLLKIFVAQQIGGNRKALKRVIDMNNFNESLSIVELEERHEMSALAMEDASLAEIERCRDRCASTK